MKKIVFFFWFLLVDMEDTGNNDVGQGTLYKPLLYMTGFKKNLDVASGGVEI